MGIRGQNDLMSGQQLGVGDVGLFTFSDNKHSPKILNFLSVCVYNVGYVAIITSSAASVFSALYSISCSWLQG